MCWEAIKLLNIFLKEKLLNSTYYIYPTNIIGHELIIGQKRCSVGSLWNIGSNGLSLQQLLKPTLDKPTKARSKDGNIQLASAAKSGAGSLVNPLA